MDRFLNKKHKLDDDRGSSVAGISSGISHIVQLVLALKLSCATVTKTICPSDSFRLEKSSHIVNVLFVVRKWQTMLWFQVS
jgi:hypothetical protein